MSCTNSPPEQTFYFRTSKKHPQCVSGKLEQSIYKHVTVCLSLQTEKKNNMIGMACLHYYNKNI